MALKALITGSSRGLGAAIARELVRDHFVIVHGTTMNSPSRLNEYSGNLYDLATELYGSYVVGDLTDPATTRNWPTDLDVLVCAAGGDIGWRGVEAANAGRPSHNNALDIEAEDIRAVLDRNILSTIHACRAVAPHMANRGGGSIVLIGSIYGRTPTIEGAIYAAAKAAVHHYGRCLAKQLRQYNIRVNVVAPGPTLTPRFEASRTPDPLMRAEIGLVRYSRAVEVARLVRAILEHPHLTGQVITLDGGLTV